MNDAARLQVGPQCRNCDPCALKPGALRVGRLDIAAQSVVPADEARHMSVTEYGARWRCRLMWLIHHDDQSRRQCLVRRVSRGRRSM